MMRVPVGLRRLHALLRKEFMLLLRDPRMRFFVVIPPIIQLVIFGFAATYDVRFAAIGLVDHADTVQTRDLRAAITGTTHYRLERYTAMAAAEQAMAVGEIRGIVVFPPDFVRQPRIQIVVDGSDSNSAQVILGQLARTLQQAAAREPPRISLAFRNWFNPNLEDRWYFVPGVMATVVLIATVSLTAMGVVRERELGTLERLMVTPLGRLEFVAGKLLPVAAIGLFDVALILVIAIFGFDIPFRGSFLALFVGTSLYLLSALGIGLLISSYVGTQQQAMLLVFFAIMPLVILSGFAFPIANMPEPVQWATWLNPLRYYLVIVRDAFLKGSGLLDYGFEFLMMGVLGLVSMGLSMLRVR